MPYTEQRQMFLSIFLLRQKLELFPSLASSLQVAIHKKKPGEHRKESENLRVAPVCRAADPQDNAQVTGWLLGAGGCRWRTCIWERAGG